MNFLRALSVVFLSMVCMGTFSGCVSAPIDDFPDEQPSNPQETPAAPKPSPVATKPPLIPPRQPQPTANPTPQSQPVVFRTACERSDAMKAALESVFRKNCQSISQVELSGLTRFAPVSLGLGSGVFRLEATDFEGLSSVEQLELSSAQALEDLPANAFSSLGKLKSLSIRLEVLKMSGAALSGLASLGALDVASAKIQAVYDAAQAPELPNLATVGIRASAVPASWLKSTLEKAPRLASLSLSAVEIRDDLGGNDALPHSLPNLKSFACDYSNIIAKDGMFSGWTAIEVFTAKTACFAEMKMFPAVFKTANAQAKLAGSELASFELSGNGVQQLDAQLFANAKKLKTLVLTNNKFVALKPEDFSALGALTALDLSGNQIREISEHSFKGALHLSALNLSRNQISLIPDAAFSDLTELKSLVLSFNFINSLNDKMLSGLSQLTTLDLSMNELSHLHEQSLQGLAALQVLDLSKNQLNLLPTGLLKGLLSLAEVSFESNRLEAIPVGFFTQDPVYPALMRINLSDNQLSSLPAGFFGSLYYLGELRLAKNAFSEAAKQAINQQLTDIGAVGVHIFY